MLTGTSKEPSSAIATATTPVLVSSSHAAPHGDCRGFAVVRIDKGHFGNVALHGLAGTDYEGDGQIQAIIDERADGKQRDACYHPVRWRDQ